MKKDLNMIIMESIDLRNRMAASFGCLQMVARHEFRRLRKAKFVRPLTLEEVDFMADYQLFNHVVPLMTKEAYRESVLKYFNIEVK